MVDTIDIEAPGADEAALRAAIQALVPISTTTISSPVNYVDIDLPAGFSAFRLTITSYGPGEDGHAFWGAFSEDGGTTWLEDTAGMWEAYEYQSMTVNASVHSADGGVSAGIEIWGEITDFDCDFIISPGSASQRASLIGTIFGFPIIVHIGHSCTLNTTRVNSLRILPYGIGDSISTPNALYSITSGTFTLYGVL